MKKVVAVFAIACLMVFSLAGCSQPEQSASGNEAATNESSTNQATPDTTAPSTVSVTHELGTVEVPVKPEKVAVLDLASLDIIDALEVGDSVVGVPKETSVSYLQSYNDDDSIANLGTVKEVDMEKLMEVEPDVIFIGGRLSEQYDALSKIAPVVLIQTDNTTGVMKSVESHIELFSQIFDKKDAGASYVEDFNKRVETLAAAAEGNSAIIGIVTSGSFSTLGNDSRCSLIGNEVGFENLAADVNSTHGDSSSFELVLEKNPDYLFVLDRDNAIKAEGADPAKEIMENEIIEKTKAFQDGNIVYLTADAWYLAEGGISAMDIMLEDLEKGVL